MLAQLGKNVAKARAAYTTFVLDGSGEEHRPEFHGAGVDSRFLGDDNFIDKCLSGSGGMAHPLTAQHIIDQVCLAYHLDVSLLSTRSQQRIASEARAVAGWLARESGCVTLSDVARLVNRDIGSISSAVRRLSDRMQDDPKLANRMMALHAALKEED